jgi:hypothetical protein
MKMKTVYSVTAVACILSLLPSHFSCPSSLQSSACSVHHRPSPRHFKFFRPAAFARLRGGAAEAECASPSLIENAQPEMYSWNGRLYALHKVNGDLVNPTALRRSITGASSGPGRSQPACSTSLRRPAAPSAPHPSLSPQPRPHRRAAAPAAKRGGSASISRQVRG